MLLVGVRAWKVSFILEAHNTTWFQGLENSSTVILMMQV